MKLRVLGSAGAELPDFRPPAFLLDERLLLDAGTIGAVLTEDEQWQLQNILVTHSHLDHIRGIPNLADNIIIKNQAHNVAVHGTAEVIGALKNHMFNDVIWPDFSRIPSEEEAVLSFETLETGRSFTIDGYDVMAVPVHHTVPAVGYIVRRGGSSIAYTGDTGPTEEFWKHVSGVDVLIVEVSFPNSMEPLALLTRHLTSELLRAELAKIPVAPARVLVTHPKPQYVDIIRDEVARLGISGAELLRDGFRLEF